MKSLSALSQWRGTRWRPILLALVVHGLLLALLVIGVNWKKKPEEPAGISAQIWNDPSPVPAASPQAKAEAPKTETPVPPKPVPKPDPKPEPKPEPKIEPKPKVEPKAEAPPKPQAKPDLVDKKLEEKKKAEEKKKLDDKKLADEKKDQEKKDADAKISEEQRRKELDRLVKTAESNAAAVNPSASSSSGSKPDADFGARLRGMLRANTVFGGADEIEGNPEVIFIVRLRPDCSIAQLRLQKTSGVPSWDAAAERAIKRTDPFPQLKDGTCPRDELLIRQKPKD